MIDLNLHKWRRKFDHFVTQQWVRLYYSLPLSGPDEYQLSTGEEITVYRFSDDSPVFAQNTLFNTIILNEDCLSDLSEEARELVIQHELGHNRRSPIFRGVWLGLLLSSALILYFILDLLLAGFSLEAMSSLGALLIVVSASFVVANRVEETMADLRAVHYLREDTFLEAYNEINSGGRSSYLDTALRTLFYTRSKTTVSLYRYLRVRGLFK